MSSFASLGDVALGIQGSIPKGKSLDRYLKDKYEWEQQNPNRTTAYGGGPRKEVSRDQPIITEELANKGAYWARTGTGDAPQEGYHGGTGDGQDSLPPTVKTPEWTLMLRQPSSAAPEPQKAASEKPSSGTEEPRFQPSQGLQDRAAAAEALDRARLYADTAAAPKPFEQGGSRLYDQVTGAGQDTLNNYFQFTVPQANQRAMLGIQEAGEALRYQAGRLSKDLALPKSMQLKDYLAAAKQFSGLIS